MCVCCSTLVIYVLNGKYYPLSKKSIKMGSQNKLLRYDTKDLIYFAIMANCMFSLAWVLAGYFCFCNIAVFGVFLACWCGMIFCVSCTSLEDQMEQAAIVYGELLEGKESPVAGSTCEFLEFLWLSNLFGSFPVVVWARMFFFFFKNIK